MLRLESFFHGPGLWWFGRGLLIVGLGVLHYDVVSVGKETETRGGIVVEKMKTKKSSEGFDRYSLRLVERTYGCYEAPLMVSEEEGIWMRVSELETVFRKRILELEKLNHDCFKHRLKESDSDNIKPCESCRERDKLLNELYNLYKKIFGKEFEKRDEDVTTLLHELESRGYGTRILKPEVRRDE